jgi:N-acetylglucosamine malate deacetylase 2
MYTEDTSVAAPALPVSAPPAFGFPVATLPAARGVLAVVARPGDESGYLGAVLDAFRLAGAAVNVLALTSGGSSPDDDASCLLDLVRSLEFDLAASVLGVERRFVLDHGDEALLRLGVDELAGHVRRVVRECDADLLVTVDGRGTESAVPHAVTRAGRECDVPVLGWTLPCDVARSVRRASGLAVTGNRSIDVEIRVRRSTQRRAMRVHRSLVREDRVQLARLAIQGDREWLRWLAT